MDMSKAGVVSNIEVYFSHLKDSTKLNDCPAVIDNPFIPEAKKEAKQKRVYYKSGDADTGMAILDEATGETMRAEAAFHKKQYVDTKQFVKIYVNKLKEFKDLSRSSINIFFHLLEEVSKSGNKNIDKIYVSKKSICKDYNYKSNFPIYQGLYELIKADVIAKTDELGIYWINPNFFFNGDRMVVINEYINKDTMQGKADKLKRLGEV